LARRNPTNVASIQFDVVFSEPVTGFDLADVDLSLSTAGGTFSVTVTGSLDGDGGLWRLDPATQVTQCPR
jgi:hypothetical protein